LRFRRADQNSDGKLDLAEVESVMQVRFPDMKSKEVRAIFNAADRNHDGGLDLQEVIDYTHSTAPARKRLREKMQMALAGPGISQSYRECEERMQFRSTDENLDGQLDINEIESLMRGSFPDVKKRDVRDIFQAADRNNDGKLDFWEFVEYTRSRDPAQGRLRDKMRTALMASQSCSDVNGTSAKGASRPSSKQNSQMRRVSSASAVGSTIARSRNSP
jgi:Ca2+-binding EF-hand superfamily protein